MALNISAWSIRNPLPSIVFSIILLVLGWVSFTKLAVTRLPSADIPVISVAVSQFGAAPAELESQVTKTIEDGVGDVELMTDLVWYTLTKDTEVYPGWSDLLADLAMREPQKPDGGRLRPNSNRRSPKPSRTASPASRACDTFPRRSPTGCR